MAKFPEINKSELVRHRPKRDSLGIDPFDKLRINPEQGRRIEKKWQKIWKQKGVYEPDLNRAKKPFYNLMMFPYPSAEGLHVGNMYAFVGSDIYGRFKRMNGYDVFEPIGLDGFGIHSENYALKIGAHPMEQAKVSKKRFYNQLQMIGNGFAWDEHLETYDPEYYKWTQWIFIQMFKNGLAYRKKQAVNWCPSCKTVLADEQVINGKCERCGTIVVKKDLEQWFFKITDFAERLLKNLEKINWSERVKVAQKEWIGRSEGAMIKFKLTTNNQQPTTDYIEIFTTRPDTLFGATYMVLSPEHTFVASLLGAEQRGLNTDLRGILENEKEVEEYVRKSKKKPERERIMDEKEKTGVELKGIKAINPANKKEIPVFVADYVLASYGTGAIMAVPAHDQRDLEFAIKFRLPIREVIKPADTSIQNSKFKNQNDNSKFKITGFAYEDEGVLINSGKFNEMDSEKAKWEITKFVNGKKKIQYHLRDWLISRQRYWGAPIPMIYCEHCAAAGKGERKEMPGWYVVPENDLPVKLPFVKDFRPKGKGQSPLASVKSFYEVKCPGCGKKAKRETDVSDTFLDSAWYYLRYPSVRMQNSKIKIQNDNSKSKINRVLETPWNQEITRRWLPVNMYIGGAEHSVLHLLYSRFITMVLCDFKLVHFEEPFTKFRAHGLLIKEGAKMSKSKGNVVNPDEYIKKFGADTLRMYLMFLAPFEQGGDFRDAGIIGIKRFLERVYKLIQNSKIKNQNDNSKSKNKNLEHLLHRTIKKITEDIENLRFNTAISALMILLNEMEKEEKLLITHYSLLITLLSPFAPYLTEELWQQIRGLTQTKHGLTRKFKSIHSEKWPQYNPKLIIEEKFELIVQVNGKVRDRISANKGIDKAQAQELALNSQKVGNFISGKAVKNVVYVQDRLINIVV